MMMTAARPPVLLIEDTVSLQLVYKSVLQNAGMRVSAHLDGQDGMQAFQRLSPQVVVLDLMLPDCDGLDLMRDILRANSDTKVIVITANGSINKAVEAMRHGAFEFLVKPFDETRFVASVENAISAGVQDSLPPPAKTDSPTDTQQLGEFIGVSPPMQDVYSRIRSVSRSMATVFITGESGTGKEICAQTIHNLSNRSDMPFVPLNCGAIPKDMLESEIFGHLKGSLPGAVEDKIGAAEAADGGTLFLDDICEMDLSLQTKLLRFLQTSTIQPVGAARAKKINVRIMCATSRNPLVEVRNRRFREDLYFRLQVVPIHLPPLRDRGDDIIHIARHTLKLLNQEEGNSFSRLNPVVQERLKAMPWPGNVRQLQNVLRNVVVLNSGPEVTMNMLPLDDVASDDLQDIPPEPPKEQSGQLRQLFQGRTMAEIERMVIEECITRNKGSIPKAARELDLSPSTIYRKRESWQKPAG